MAWDRVRGVWTFLFIFTGFGRVCNFHVHPYGNEYVFARSVCNNTLLQQLNNDDKMELFQQPTTFRRTKKKSFTIYFIHRIVFYARDLTVAIACLNAYTYMTLQSERNWRLLTINLCSKTVDLFTNIVSYNDAFFWRCAHSNRIQKKKRESHSKSNVHEICKCVAYAKWICTEIECVIYSSSQINSLQSSYRIIANAEPLLCYFILGVCE